MTPADDALLTADDVYLWNEGPRHRLYRSMSSRPFPDGQGAYCATWAPNADSLAVIGDWSDWSPDADRLQPLERTRESTPSTKRGSG